MVFRPVSATSVEGDLAKYREMPGTSADRPFDALGLMADYKIMPKLSDANTGLHPMLIQIKADRQGGDVRLPQDSKGQLPDQVQTKPREQTPTSSTKFKEMPKLNEAGLDPVIAAKLKEAQQRPANGDVPPAEGSQNPAPDNSRTEPGDKTTNPSSEVTPPLPKSDAPVEPVPKDTREPEIHHKDDVPPPTGSPTQGQQEPMPQFLDGEVINTGIYKLRH
jgi:hypothetical protein